MSRTARTRQTLIAVLASAAMLAVPVAVWPNQASAAPVGNLSKFVAVQPERILDTREGFGAPQGKVAPRGQLRLQMLGRGGVPTSGVSAVVLNVTSTQTSGAGYVQVFPTGQSTPGAFSNINHTGVGQTIAGLVTAPVGDGGTVTLYSEGGGHLLTDVFGYYTVSGATSDGRYVALSPSRLLDTRTTPEPAPSTQPAPGPTPAPTQSKPANPGETKSCTDFSTRREAQAYFDFYYPHYGDVARLDGDNDLIACESLPAYRRSYAKAPRAVPRRSRSPAVGASLLAACRRWP